MGSVLVYMLLGTLPPSKSCNRIILYRSFHKEARLGGWGVEGLKGPTLGRHLGCVRYYTCVRHISACASIL